MYTISIDLATKSTGIAIYKDKSLLGYSCLQESSTNLYKRIQGMILQIKQFILKYDIPTKQVSYLVLEQVRPDNTSGNLVTHKALMHMQGCLMLMLYASFPQVKVNYLYPSEWRKVCGIKQGRGVRRQELKRQDIQWAQNTFNINLNGNDDIADAIGIGYAFINK